MKFYLDFGLERKKLSCLNQTGKFFSTNPKELRIKKGDKVYLEYGGHSEWFVRDLLGREVEVFQIPGTVVAEKRKELGWKKSHLDDAKIIKILAEERPDRFHKAKIPEKELLLLEENIKAYNKVNRAFQDLAKTKESKSKGEDYVRDCWNLIFEIGKQSGIEVENYQKWLEVIKAEIERLTRETKLFKEVFCSVIGEEKAFETGLIINYIKNVVRFDNENQLRSLARFQVTREGKKVTAKSKVGGSKFLHGLIAVLADHVYKEFRGGEHPFWKDRIERIYQRQLGKSNQKVALLNTKATISRVIIRQIYKGWKRYSTKRP